MAGPGSREFTNRKILEELEQNKKILKQGGVPPLITSIQPLPSGSLSSMASSGNNDLTSTQRSALNVAYSQSYGFYIPQDSSFGNLLLPVLPRFENKK